MNLKEFTKQTLLQIVESVSEINKEIAHTGANIPATFYQSGGKVTENNSDAGKGIVDVDFDVAITATDASSAEGGAGLTVLSISLGGKMDSKTENQIISRVKFSLPLVLPEQNK